MDPSARDPALDALALGRAAVVAPDHVAVLRRATDDVIIGYVVRIPDDYAVHHAAPTGEDTTA